MTALDTTHHNITQQLEVAERIVAKPSTKQYGIPSVVFQLYAAPKINFKIPPSVFYPKPNVDSALLTLGDLTLLCGAQFCTFVSSLYLISFSFLLNIIGSQAML